MSAHSSSAAQSAAASGDDVVKILQDFRDENSKHLRRLEDSLKRETVTYNRRLDALFERLSVVLSSNMSSDASLIRRKRNRSPSAPVPSARRTRNPSTADVTGPSVDNSKQDKLETVETVEPAEAADAAEAAEAAEASDADESDKEADSRVTKVARTKEVMDEADTKNTPRKPSTSSRKANKVPSPRDVSLTLNPNLDPTKRCLFVAKSGARSGVLCNAERLPGCVTCKYHNGRQPRSPVQTKWHNRIKEVPREYLLKLFKDAMIPNPEQVLDRELSLPDADAAGAASVYCGASTHVGDGATVAFDGASEYADAMSVAASAVPVPLEAGAARAGKTVPANRLCGAAAAAAPLPSDHSMETISVADMVHTVDAKVQSERKPKRATESRKKPLKSSAAGASASAANSATSIESTGASTISTVDLVPDAVPVAAIVQHPETIQILRGLPENHFMHTPTRLVVEYLGPRNYKAVGFLVDFTDTTKYITLDDRKMKLAKDNGFAVDDVTMVDSVLAPVEPVARPAGRARSPSQASSKSLSRNVVMLSLNEVRNEGVPSACGGKTTFAARALASSSGASSPRDTQSADQIAAIRRAREIAASGSTSPTVTNLPTSTPLTPARFDD